jgi:hypothetical protein
MERWLRAFLSNLAGWLLFQTVEYLVALLIFTSLLPDDPPLWLSVPAFVLMLVVLTILNVRARRRWLPPDPRSPSGR